MKRFLFFILYFATFNIYSQVKIGDNPSIIDSNSILELESSDKVLVITRLTDAEMNSIQPLRGALVYNTDSDCVYTYNGTTWVSLCSNSTSNNITVTTSGSAPTNNSMGDFWINDANNNYVSIWDGSQWIPIDTNPRRGNGAPDSSNAPNPIAGDLYVDQTTGIIYAYNGSSWVNSSTSVNANNGVFVAANNTIQLGGVLIRPTTITTDATNTLAIQGLQDGDVTQDDIVTVNQTTGELRRVNLSSLMREEVAEITAINGQTQFTAPLPITDGRKVNVYRNGVRVDFTIVNTTTIEVEAGAICFDGDQIRIVQFY
ncbi:hypothetical protein [Tenacibaculum geojense]|uniref:Uncharacterized protein n=1 Tax=Tenacibaculum geojense TaxID=915352 RepID=A0ABW3JWW0_9FLAO